MTATVIAMSRRQSKPAPSVSGDVESTRMRFAAILRRRIITEIGIPEDKAAGWLADKMDVRWQTAQFWLDGKSFPVGQNLTLLSEAIGVPARDLLGPLSDDIDPRWPTWREFLGTPEGVSMNDEERWTLRLFGWPKPPTVGDYRSLLALVRSNAERAAS